MNGSQIPSLIFSILFFINSLYYFNSILEGSKNYIIFFLNFSIFIQLVSFYLFSSLASEYLGFKKNKINKIYKYLSFNKSIMFLLTILIFAILLLINFEYNYINFSFNNLYFGIFLLIFSVQSIINVLIISILEYFNLNR